jgi:hypothetical protein
MRNHTSLFEKGSLMRRFLVPFAVSAVTGGAITALVLRYAGIAALVAH